jgi:hypothetical protein
LILVGTNWPWVQLTGRVPDGREEGHRAKAFHHSSRLGLASFYSGCCWAQLLGRGLEAFALNFAIAWYSAACLAPAKKKALP